jgi:hypothetical protein
MKDSGAAFRFCEGLFRRRPFIRRIEHGSCFGVIVVFLQACFCSPMAEQHQGVIDSYARYPSGKGGVFAKSADVCESPLKRTLNCIFRILSIAKHPEGSVIDPNSMYLTALRRNE